MPDQSDVSIMCVNQLEASIAWRGEAALLARDVVELGGAPPGVGGVVLHGVAAPVTTSRSGTSCVHKILLNYKHLHQIFSLDCKV